MKKAKGLEQYFKPIFFLILILTLISLISSLRLIYIIGNQSFLLLALISCLVMLFLLIFVWKKERWAIKGMVIFGTIKVIDTILGLSVMGLERHLLLSLTVGVLIAVYFLNYLSSTKEVEK